MCRHHFHCYNVIMLSFYKDMFYYSMRIKSFLSPENVNAHAQPLSIANQQAIPNN